MNYELLYKLAIEENDKLKSDVNLDDCKIITDYYEISNLKKVILVISNQSNILFD